ncbi:MAG: hypothetical protein ACRD2F_02750 [Terriglobales bacterium]
MPVSEATAAAVWRYEAKLRNIWVPASSVFSAEDLVRREIALSPVSGAAERQSTGLPGALGSRDIIAGVVALAVFCASRIPGIAAGADLWLKISSFARLGNNWDNEGAEAPSESTVGAAQETALWLTLPLAARAGEGPRPSVCLFADGSVFFKWIYREKELQVTVDGRSVAVQRWHPLECFESEGRWEDLKPPAVLEHARWLLE